MVGYLLAGVFVLAICAVAIWAIIEYKQKLFCQAFACDEGDFIVKGRKDKFIIQKDNRFQFLVVDGKIISVKDKLASKRPVRYGGNENG